MSSTGYIKVFVTCFRITCTNQVSKVNLIKKETLEDASKKEFTTTVMDTKGDSIESNIRSIFGSKRNQNLLKIVEKSPTPSVLNEFGLENKKVDLEIFKLEGYISSCAHGCGRSGSDRQFFYINSRPIDNPKVIKPVIVWKFSLKKIIKTN